ncbi:GntR family transcriptional regulator [Bordetella genomosp. 9]|uniref:GntR family transcriptional regulator n=1 Tax=Bordetella genomosp. 9 TaxID=1416803 RepID=A0A261R3J8_9BORD|nr:PLP-dependent aminotransferase family protein [Bordetella genomosp. 9]OZI19222.1 GntR family transcriptional regulator [Bordetella genomosp. 9]
MRPSPLSPIIEKLAADIRNGRLAPGAALPTHRELAARHGVAIASASKVYARLKDMGLVIGETGRGTFVRDRPRERDWDPGDEARLSAAATDLSFNHPTWPGQADLLRGMLRELAGSGDLAALMHQQPPGGRRHERQIVADFLARERGIRADPQCVFLVNGAQQGLDIAVRALLRAHDMVAVDALTYPGFKMLAEARELVLKPVPASPPGAAEGPDPQALDALCRRHPVRAIYAMPTLHNPLGWVLTARQRARLVDIARRHDCLIVEDAAYAYLAGNAPPSLVTLAAERTVYVSSLSKSLASGLRFGYVVAPPSMAMRIKAQIRASYWSLPSLVTAMATRWMQDGTVKRLESEHRHGARLRQAVARKVFAGMDMTAHPNALFVWLRLPPELRADRIAMALAERQIAVSKAEAYATTRHAPQALRLGLGSVPLDELQAVLARVRDVIDAYPI